MKVKVFCMFVMVLLSIMAAPASAQGGPPIQSWILINNNGRISAVEASSGVTIHITAGMGIQNATLVADQPVWSNDGKRLSFLMAGQLAIRSDGDIVWMDFGSYDLNIMSLCQEVRIKCTFASIFGDWLLFTAIRDGDNMSSLIAFNVVTGEMVTLRAGGFEPDPGAYWQSNGTYVLHGRFGGQKIVDRIFAMPGTTPIPPNAQPVPTPDTTAPVNPTFLGCNGEVATQKGPNVEIAFNGKIQTYPGKLYGAAPWRACDASPVTFPPMG